MNKPSAEVRRRGAGRLYAGLALAQLLAWGWAVLAFHAHPLLLGTAAVAYGLGLRHAIDIDHLAAIDNVTRKLMAENRNSAAVGLFFSLGHSTIVLALTAAIAGGATILETRFGLLRHVGGIVGTAISALFLFVIALANLQVLAGLWRDRSRGGAAHSHSHSHSHSGGMMTWLFGRLFRLVGRSWHMYPLGVLFGLGFDTATEIGLLGISATEAARGLPLWSILVFPALFAAAMSLADTTDGVLVAGAYGWAGGDSRRRWRYDMGVTALSVAAAVAVGAIEAAGLIGSGANGFWASVAGLQNEFGRMSVLAVGLTLAGWVVATTWRRRARAPAADLTSS